MFGPEIKNRDVHWSRHPTTLRLLRTHSWRAPVKNRLYRNNCLRALSLFLLLLLTAGLASAQSTSGSIGGTIEDTSGAIVRHATVSITQQDRDFTQKMETNDQGGFRFLQLPPGTYTLRISAPGFKDVEKQNIVLENAGSVDLREINLPIGAAVE